MKTLLLSRNRSLPLVFVSLLSGPLTGILIKARKTLSLILLHLSTYVNKRSLLLIGAFAFILEASAQAPAISSFSPTSGPVGTTVTITGTNFDPVASNNTVYFGAAKATVIAATSTSLTVNVPAGTTYEPITVTTRGLTAYASKQFVATFANSCTDFQPNSFALKSGFDVGSSYSSGGNNAIQVADFDGDGKPDLTIATSSSAGLGVSFYRNTSTVGNITFAPKIFYPAPASHQMAIGDLNGDGKPDLVTVSDSIQILINTSTPGNISFNMIPNFPPGLYRGIAINDFDGDGKPDLAATAPVNGVVSVFRNTTSGGLVSFAEKVSFPVSSSAFNLEARDLDNDGKADLAVAYQQLDVLRNTSTVGSISFAPKVSLPYLAGGLLTIGDLNEDNKPDIALSQRILKNNSSISNIEFSEVVSNFVSVPVISDLNGDGKPDIAARQTGAVSLYQNTGANGEISFAQATNYSFNFFPNTFPPTGLAAVDLDLDGKPDLVLSLISTNTFIVFRNQINEVPCTAVVLPPTITSFSPTSGPVGTTVNITGTNFSPIAANNIVYFGAVKATVTAATSTSLIVTAPAGATYQPITVTTGGLTAYSTKPFIATFAANSTGFTPTSFAPKVDYPASDGPRNVAIVDLDGDGRSDMVSTNINANSISVLRNISTNNTLAFASKIDFQMGIQPFRIAFGDLDGDGRPDLAVKSSSGTVSLLRNMSTTGTIAFATRIDLSGVAGAGSIAIADLDGDGKPDLAVTSGSSGTVSLFRNISTIGTLAFATRIELSGVAGGSVAIADLDDDGKPDLAVGNASSNNVSVLRNTSTIGTVAFAAKVDYPVISGNAPIAVGDVDGDGKQDIVISHGNVASSSGFISVLRNTSTHGALSFAARLDFATNIPAQGMALGNLDGDAKPDIVISFPLGNNVVSILKNISTPGTPNFATGANYTVDIGLFNASIGDLNGDGQADIALPNSNLNTVSVLINQVPSTPSIPSPPTITSFSPTSGPVGATVTITGTNFDPIAANNIVYFGAVKATVTAATSTSLTVTVPTGATYQPITVTTNSLTAYSKKPFVVTFQNSTTAFNANSFAPRIEFATEPNPSSVAIGDLNQDGKPDMVVANFSSTAPTLSIFPNTSTGQMVSYGARINYAVGGSIAGNATLINNQQSIAVSDLDGDGKLDIAIVNALSNTVSVFKNISSGSAIAFLPKVDYLTGTRPGNVAISDLDKDGKPDLVVTNGASANVSIFRNVSTSGNLTFSSRVDLQVGNGPEGLTITDIDGDNLPDLVVANFFSFSISLLRNISTPGVIAFANRIDIPTGPQPSSVAAGDLDGDDRPDLAVSIYPQTLSSISVYRNLSTPGTFAFAGKVDYQTGSNPGSIAMADLNGDGKLDLATSNATANTISVFRNMSSSGTISFDTRMDYASGNGTGNIAIGDINTDGKPDLFVNNYTANTISVLINNQSGGCNLSFLNNGQIVLDASCGNNDGNITIVPTQGSGVTPFMYSINGGVTYVAGPNTGRTFLNLSAGVYQLRLKDANGCESQIVERRVRLNCPASCNLSIASDISVVATNCGGSTGSITLRPTGGTAPFLYSNNGGLTYVEGPNNGYTFSNLEAGTYKLMLQDVNGCVSTVTERTVNSINCPTTCTPPTFLNNGTIVLDASCGKNDGNISIIPTSGFSPFMYSIDGGLTYVAGPKNGFTFLNLSAGTYRLRLKDAAGCESAIVERTVRNFYGCPGAITGNNPGINSKVSAAGIEANKDVITTYPNPNHGQFKVLLQNFASSRAEVLLVDAKGSTIQKRSLNLNQNTITDFDLRGKARGMYYIRVVSSNGTKVSKVVIQ